jgi:hypothetical protein
MKIRALALSLSLLLLPWAAHATLISYGVGPVTPGTAASNSILGGGVFNSAAPTLSNGQQAADQLDAAGNLMVNIAAGLAIGPGPQAGGVLIAFPTNIPPLPVSQPDVPSSNTIAANTVGSAYPIVLGTGAQAIIWKVAGLSGTGAVIAAQGSSDAGATFSASVSMLPFPNGPWVTSITTDGTYCTNVGGLGSAQLIITSAGSAATVTINSSVTVSSCPTVPGPSPGIPFTILTAASNNSTVLKASPGTLYSPTWINITTTLMDIRFYDTASAPTCSSATGMKLNYPAQSNAISSGGSAAFPAAGVTFVNGIGVCITGITGSLSNNDNTSAVVGLSLTGSFN